MNVYCVNHPTIEAEYDTPDDICNECWVNWWCEDLEQEGFTPEQIARYREDCIDIVYERYLHEKDDGYYYRDDKLCYAGGPYETRDEAYNAYWNEYDKGRWSKLPQLVRYCWQVLNWV